MLFFCWLGSAVDVLLLMLEYVVMGVFFCRSLVHDDVEEVVLIEAVSDEEEEEEALELLVKREKGLDGIIVRFVGDG